MFVDAFALKREFVADNIEEDSRLSLLTLLIFPDAEDFGSSRDCRNFKHKFDKNLENKLNKFKLSDNNIEGNIIINNIKDTIMDLFYKDKNFTVEDVTEGIEETVTKALNKFEDFKGIQNKNPNPSDLNPPKKNMSIVQSEPSDLKEPEEKIKKEG